MNRDQAALGAAAVLIGGLVYAAYKTTGNADFTQPQAQAAPDDDLASFRNHNLDGHPGRVCERADHHAGYTYTRHRYPRVCGGEITALIHRGYSPMRIPRDTPDVQWIIAPPSEVMF